MNSKDILKNKKCGGNSLPILDLYYKVIMTGAGINIDFLIGWYNIGCYQISRKKPNICGQLILDGVAENIKWSTDSLLNK